MDISLLLRGQSLNQVLGRLLPEDRVVRELLASLRPGQTLQARVLAAPTAELARLLIQDVAITARTGRALNAGQVLTLTVLKAGEQPQLRVEAPPRQPTAQDVMRLALPRQLPLRETLSGLTQLAERALPLLSGNAREALRGLIERHVPARQPSANDLRQAVKDSGLFTEARLARGQPPEPGDRKAMLLRLAAELPARPGPSPSETARGQPPAALSRASLGSISPTMEPLSRAALLGSALANGQAAETGHASRGGKPLPPEQVVLERLWRLVEASLARIQSHQAASLPADDGAPPAWQLEIPVAMPGGPAQVIDLRIEQEPPGDEDANPEAGWLVTIGFVFAELGPVKAGVRLASGRISTTFWCERPDAVRRFERHLPQLQQALESAGLEVAHLAASQGVPPGEATREPNRLLDERV
jgi:hypothetical protein